LRDLKKRCAEVDDRAERIRQDRTAPAYLAHFLGRHSGATPTVLADLERKYNEAKVAQEAERKLHVEEIQTTGEELKVRNKKARMEASATLESKKKELEDRLIVDEDKNIRDDRPDPPRTACDNNADAIHSAKRILQAGKERITHMVEASNFEINDALVAVLDEADSVPLDPKRDMLTPQQISDIRPHAPEAKKLQPGWMLPSGGVVTEGGQMDQHSETKELFYQVDQTIKKVKEALKS
jgi:hypothetical protein